jgi:hypothetical protein
VNSSSGLSAGAKAAISIGASVRVVIIALLVFGMIYQRCNRAKQSVDKVMLGETSPSQKNLTGDMASSLRSVK